MGRLCGGATAISTQSVASPPIRLHQLRAATEVPPPTAGAAADSDLSVAVVGAGPVGLLVAIALFRRGFRKLRVFDRLPRPPTPDATIWGNSERSYNLGIGERGLKSLRKFQVLDTVDRWSQTVLGRTDYKQDGSDPTVTLQKKRMPSRIIARDRLSSCVFEELSKTCPGLEVDFSVECEGADFHEDGATLRMRRCGESAASGSPEAEEECEVDGDPFSFNADVVIGADGVNSDVRAAMERAGARTHKRVLGDRSPTVYKTLPITMPADSRKDLNHGTRQGSIGIEALPNVEGTLGGVVLFKPSDERFTNMKSADDARETFKELFPDWPLPQLSEAELEGFAKRRVRNLPQFSYCGPSLNLGGKAVLVGDAIHSVKPYFGLGVNSGFEDVSILDDCIGDANGDLGDAFERFSRRRAPDARNMVESQYKLDQPTKLRTFMFFVGPLLIDTLCNKFLPTVFAPSTLRLFGNSDYTFSQIRARKRRDRTLQVLMLLALGCGAVSGARGLAHLVRLVLLRG